MCPHCHQNSPVIYRGLMAYCTACGKARPPLTDSSVTLAGKPSQVGGALMTVAGWLVLVGGVGVSLLVAFVLNVISPHNALALAVGIPMVLMALVLGILMLRSGKSLTRSGTGAEQAARLRAIDGLAAHRGGILRAPDVAQAIQIGVPEAEALLTELAKTQSDRVSLEVDDQGGLYYRISGGPGTPLGPRWPEPRGGRVSVPEDRVTEVPVVSETGEAEEEFEERRDLRRGNRR